MARQLHAHRPPAAIEEMLAVAVKGCGRAVPLSEIAAAVNASKSYSPNTFKGSAGHRKFAPITTSPQWPGLNTSLRSKVIAVSKSALHKLISASPTSIDEDEPDADWFINQLFPGDPLLCIAKTPYDFSTARRHLYRTCLHNKSLIVPSPMSDYDGLTKSGKVSKHTLANTGPRRYLVTEFDSGSPDDQAALISHLGGFAPLVMVLSSGGKSLHAWWNCVGTNDELQLRFFRYAVSLGADPATWLRSQFVRLPQGWRADKDTLQQVYYFNPACLPAALEVEGA
jgi:hypothetical protein